MVIHYFCITVILVVISYVIGIGTGWHHGDSESSTPRKRIVVRLDGPEVGYLATSICIVTSALCLVKETEKLSLRYSSNGFINSYNKKNNGRVTVVSV